MGVLLCLLAVLVEPTAPYAGSAATADSVYLKSGAVIRTDHARIEGGRVVFEQYGARVAIPLGIVDRVVDDDFTGPRPTERVSAAASRTASPTSPATLLPQPTPDEPTRERARHPGQPGRDAASSQRNRQSPQESKRATRAKREDLESMRAFLKSMRAFLKRAETAFLFSHRSTSEVKQKIADVDEWLARLDGEDRPGGKKRGSGAEREGLESMRAFLKRAEAAFLHSHRSTAEVKQKIRAVDDRLRSLRGG